MKGPTVISLLRQQKDFSVHIVACDMDPLSAGLYFADSHYLVPKANHPNYIPRLLSICKKERINVVLPLLSSELPVLSQNIDHFKKHDVEVIISAWPTIKTSQDKWLTYLFFRKHRIPTPKTWLPELLKKKLTFPLMVKPRISSGTKNITRAENRAQLTTAVKTAADPIVQNYIRGQEYTIDVIADRNGRLLGAVPRMRIRVMDGKSVKAKTVRHPMILKLTRRIVKALNLYGPANIQCIETTKKALFFTEVNPRLAAGGLPLTVAAGLDIPLLCVKLGLGERIGSQQTITKNLYMLRYLAEVFVTERENQFERV